MMYLQHELVTAFRLTPVYEVAQRQSDFNSSAFGNVMNGVNERKMEGRCLFQTWKTTLSEVSRGFIGVNI